MTTDFDGVPGSISGASVGSISGLVAEDANG